ncbi:ABC transporter ATP-binding protein [Halalkalibacillus sediminis]|uniref:ABC transporter ATP-binding protein n=1 Tax=Halalkalibacillus sediminis TaxID=2018042 RepID=A0A2I0QRF5_9BACI|nr:ABC transporter ATP-binding protein [Halalkalibacillus sediminis]PKR76914.1 ABC transporter ATP-binding protein [Halalkalibacillus sediminis]
MERETIIEVKDIVKSYKKRKSKEIVHAVKGVSFNVYKGEILGLLGPNGAGKTTTIKTICGLLKQNEGSVYINGQNVQDNRLKALRHISAVLEGNRNLYWRHTVQENMEYFAGNRGRGRKDAQEDIGKLLTQFRLLDKKNELVSSLSRGMQQKLAIAVAMLADSEVILLDEPTLGLDVETGYEVRELLKDIVRDQEKTIIISTHDMPVVQDLCERTVIINEGKVIADEKVSRLIDLFETRAYSIKLGEPLSELQQQAVKHTFPIYQIHDDQLDVTLEQEDDIYELMDILKKEKTRIEKIDRTTVDFEQVFMELVREEEPRHAASTSN